LISLEQVLLTIKKIKRTKNFIQLKYLPKGKASYENRRT